MNTKPLAITNSLASTNLKGKKILDLLSSNYVYPAFFVLFLFGAMRSPVFFTVNNLNTVLLQNSYGAIIAVGMLFVVITGGIDLSVGSVVALSVCLASGFIQDGLGVLGVVGVVLLMALCGAITGVLVAYGGIAPFVATLSMMTILKGLAYMYQVGQDRRIDGTFLPKYIQSSSLGIPNPVWILLVVMLFCSFVLRNTTFGRSIFAVGGNVETTRLAGIPVKPVLLLSYTISGFLSGLAGVILCGRLSMGTSQVGAGFEMDAIAAVVVGGAPLSGGSGSVLKTVVGAFLIGILSNIMNLMGIASYPQMVIKGIIIVIAVLFKKR